MSEAQTTRERSRDLERLLTFVDAIVAIAITLLVLPLVDSVGELGNGASVRSFLVDHRDLLAAFLLSFLVIANLWQVQHRVLRTVVASSDRLTRLLVAWSLTMVFLPFPTALMARPGSVGDQVTTKLLYVGTMTVSSLVLSAMSLLIARHDDLRDTSERPDVVRGFATTLTFVVALGVMLLLPGTSYWPLLLLLLSDRVVDLWHRRRERTAHRPG